MSASGWRCARSTARPLPSNRWQVDRIELDRDPLVDARRDLAVGLDDDHLAACQLGVEEGLAAKPLDHHHLADELARRRRPQVLGPDAERDRIARPLDGPAGPAR